MRSLRRSKNTKTVFDIPETIKKENGRQIRIYVSNIGPGGLVWNGVGLFQRSNCFQETFQEK